MTDVVTLLTFDHRHVEAMLEELSESEEGPDRDRTIARLQKALSLHMEFEERELYPLVAQFDGEMQEEAQIEHGLAREGLEKLTELAAAPGFGAAVDMVAGGISHHVSEEEEEVFPKLRQRCDAEQLRALGQELRRAQLAAGMEMYVPEDASKDDLLELARDAEIEGRSQMTKEQLREAVMAQ